MFYFHTRQDLPLAVSSSESKIFPYLLVGLQEKNLSRVFKNMIYIVHHAEKNDAFTSVILFNMYYRACELWVVDACKTLAFCLSSLWYYVVSLCLVLKFV